jgi:hypothetical protein
LRRHGAAVRETTQPTAHAHRKRARKPLIRNHFPRHRDKRSKELTAKTAMPGAARGNGGVHARTWRRFRFRARLRTRIDARPQAPRRRVPPRADHSARFLIETAKGAIYSHARSFASETMKYPIT